ncbi:response regulator [Bacteriovoracales bacterium]|nr:response regulator [Bacteriovoracales bacterium]
MTIKPNMKVLIIDDMKTLLLTYKKMLKTLGLSNISSAFDGDMGWKMIREAYEADDPFELIISDWNMPKMTGLELLKAVRKDENLKGTPFIMITGENAEGNVVIAVREGVNNFIAKPITKDILEFKIQKVFEK